MVRLSLRFEQNLINKYISKLKYFKMVTFLYVMYVYWRLIVALQYIH